MSDSQYVLEACLVSVAKRGRSMPLPSQISCHPQSAGAYEEITRMGASQYTSCVPSGTALERQSLFVSPPLVVIRQRRWFTLLQLREKM
jgi:hypothetical protein